MTVPVPLRAAAELELRRRRKAQDGRVVGSIVPAMPFPDWLAVNRPEWRWDARHFRVMQDVLGRVTDGTARRVFFQLPIRHGKTEHNTISYAAYRLTQTPHRARIIVASYNQPRADWLSRQVRKLAITCGVVMGDKDTVREWETASGGYVVAVGAGAGVAGLNADLILIDDPIGNREEAESQAHRDRVWDWITNDLLARCEPQTAVLFTMSRWHQDDPAGRLRDGRAGEWEIIDLPGRAEDGDALGRQPNEPLWPEERPETWLDEQRAQLTEYGFASMIQGRPRPREGGMFKWDWWQTIEAIPQTGDMVRYWDLAGTEPKGRSHDPDYSAGVLMCRMEDNRTAVVDVARFRHSIAQRDAALMRVAKSDVELYGYRVTWWIEAEAGIAGEERTQHIVRNLQALGLPVYTERPTGNKVHRAEPLASAAEAKNVLLCPGEWRNEFRMEAADFPNGKHDDQIDAAAGAFAKLAQSRTARVLEVFI